MNEETANVRLARIEENLKHISDQQKANKETVRSEHVAIKSSIETLMNRIDSWDKTMISFEVSMRELNGMKHRIEEVEKKNLETDKKVNRMWWMAAGIAAAAGFIGKHGGTLIRGG